jgi:hypothetical protein
MAPGDFSGSYFLGARAAPACEIWIYSNYHDDKLDIHEHG